MTTPIPTATRTATRRTIPRRDKTVEDKILQFFVEKRTDIAKFDDLAKYMDNAGISFNRFYISLYYFVEDKIIVYDSLNSCFFLIKEEEILLRFLGLKRRSAALMLCSLLLTHKNFILRNREVIFDRTTFFMKNNKYLVRMFTPRAKINITFYNSVQELKNRTFVEKIEDKDQYRLLYQHVPAEILQYIIGI